MSQFEIEIKSLLGTKENADKLKQKLAEKGVDLSKAKQSKQLNHYFTYTDLSKFHDSLLPHISEDKRELFSKIVKEGKKFSIRTRQANEKIILVIKASLDDHSSSNGISRMEFESEMNMTLDELDKLLLDAGLQYQAKWSREREEYELGDAAVCIDKNAGYGYLAEFESVVNDKSQVDDVKEKLFSLMDEFGVEELKQDRLERMFEFYNIHWPEYYGTDKTFIIE
jgi:predicted adenylyl cyclase CyaB